MAVMLGYVKVKWPEKFGYGKVMLVFGHGKRLYDGSGWCSKIRLQ